MERNLKIRDFNLSRKALKKLSKAVNLSVYDTEWTSVRNIVDLLFVSTDYSESRTDNVGTFEFKLSKNWSFILTILDYNDGAGTEQIHHSTIDIQCKKKTKKQRLLMAFDNAYLPEEYRDRLMKELIKTI